MTEGNNELLTLVNLFADDRSFRVPDYQRGYSWEARQVKDLLDDIESIVDRNYSHKHYTGTIVACVSSEKDAECFANCYDIVDGQQRLTTLLILMNELLNHGANMGLANREDLKELMIEKQEAIGVTKRRFKLNKETDRFFKNSILKAHPDDDSESSLLNKSHQNLKVAQKEIKDWLQGRTDKKVLIIDAIVSRLGFMFYSPTSNEEVGLMFEVINNRGKELSELEKIKNYLIYYAVKLNLRDLSVKVNEDWGQILRNLSICKITSNEDENAFLRNCWIVYEDTRKSESYYVYDNLKKKYPTDIDDEKKSIDYEHLKKFVIFINKASQYYTKLFVQQGVEDKEEKRLLTLLSLQQSIASVIPLILAIYCHEGDSRLRVKLVDLVEKLNFRYYGCHIAGRSDTGQGELFNLAHQYYNKFGQTIDQNKIDSLWLEVKLKEFVKNNANDEGFVKALTLDKNESGDYYAWGSLKYFLANYEEELLKGQKQPIYFKNMFAPRNKEALNASYDREHIWAVQETTIIDDEQDRHINKRRLGNFVLLEPTLNIQRSNDRIEKKIDDYYNLKVISKAMMLRELREIFEKEENELKENGVWKNRGKKYWLELYTRFFDRREERMINFALARWRVDYSAIHVQNVKIDSMGKENSVYQEIKSSPLEDCPEGV